MDNTITTNQLNYRSIICYKMDICRLGHGGFALTREYFNIYKVVYYQLITFPTIFSRMSSISSLTSEMNELKAKLKCRH